MEMRRGSAPPRLRAVLCAGVVMLAMGLAACGSSDDSSSGGTTGGGGGTSGTIVIGANMPFTGPAATIGKIADGIEAYVADVNANGGVQGAQLKFVREDDAADPAKSPAAVRKLVEEDGAVLVCGTGTTGTYQAISDYLGAKGVAGIPSTGTSTLLNDHTFQVITPYEKASARLVDFAVDDLKIDKIAVAAGKDDIGKGMADGATAQAKARGIAPPTIVDFDPATTSFAPQAAKLKASGAQYVIINGSLPVITGVIKASAQIGYTPEWGTTWAGLDPEFAKLSGPQVDGHSYFVTPFLETSSPKTATYQAAMKKYKPSSDPSSLYPLEGWTIAEACVDGIEAAAQKAGGVPTSQQILESLPGVTIDSGYVNGLAWTEEDHSGAKQTQILTLKSGKIVPAAPFAEPASS
jgi:ABC-type branched-subunit amino acid transport system substrate-binding protein